MEEPRGRHEIKHVINGLDLLLLRSRLDCVMARDEHADAEGGYRVRSLYFDNYNDKALREKVDGVDSREKFRLRFYGNKPEQIRLEKKSKRNGLCYKSVAPIGVEVCEALLRGDYEALKQGGEGLHWELYAKMRSQLLRPKTVVDYRREAFVFAPGNVRVTLDYDMRTSLLAEDFLSVEAVSFPLPQVMLLEVKYDGFLPEVVRGAVALSSRQGAAFSKYAAARLV